METFLTIGPMVLVRKHNLFAHVVRVIHNNDMIQNQVLYEQRQYRGYIYLVGGEEQDGLLFSAKENIIHNNESESSSHNNCEYFSFLLKTWHTVRLITMKRSFIVSISFLIAVSLVQSLCSFQCYFIHPSCYFHS